MTAHLANLRGILGEIHAERDRQERKWGQQNHPNRFWSPRTNTTRDDFDLAQYQAQADFWKQVNADRVKQRNDEGLGSDRNAAWDGILLEEVFEALSEEDDTSIREELIQVAAVAVAWIQAIDRRRPRKQQPTPGKGS